jgi:invasion protein IalB
MTIADKLLAAMRTGSELKVTMQDANKKPVDIGLPLLGFGLAFDKAK